MRSLLVALTLLTLATSCSEEKTNNHPKYIDPWRENFNGEPASIELHSFKVDSAGHLRPDSVARELGEWKDDYLRIYTEFDSAGRPLTTVTYTYHPNGKPHLQTVEKQGKMAEKYESLLDSNGHDLLTRVYDSSGKLSSYYTGITENAEGFMLTASLFNADSFLQTRINADYDRRRITKIVYTDSSGKVIMRNATTLDDQGNKIADTLVSFVKDSATTRIKKYRYDSYDSLKNWLQQTELDADGKALKVVKRKIVYAKKED